MSSNFLIQPVIQYLQEDETKKITVNEYTQSYGGYRTRIKCMKQIDFEAAENYFLENIDFILTRSNKF